MKTNDKIINSAEQIMQNAICKCAIKESNSALSLSFCNNGYNG